MTVFFSVLVPFQMGFTVLTPTHYQTCMDPDVGQTGIAAIIMTPAIAQSGLSEQWYKLPDKTMSLYLKLSHIHILLHPLKHNIH